MLQLMVVGEEAGLSVDVTVSPTKARIGRSVPYDEICRRGARALGPHRGRGVATPRSVRVSPIAERITIRVMRLYVRSLFVFVMGVTVHPGCSATSAPQCGAIAMVLPVITVTDAATAQLICDATVIAKCGDAGAELVAFGPNGYNNDATVSGCHYGPGLQGVCDVATIYVSKPGYKTEIVPDVEVRYSPRCPGPIPDPQQVSVAMEPG